ncbi:unnamed protein product, partial [marine sediment metagenome]
DNDILKSLEHLNSNGTIVIHDCNPPHEFFQRDNYNQRYNFGCKQNNLIWNNKEYTDRHWNGKTWKIIAKLRSTRSDLSICTIDADWGLGIIRFGTQKLFDKIKGDALYQYQTLIKYRGEILNLLSVEEFLEKFSEKNNLFV